MNTWKKWTIYKFKMFIQLKLMNKFSIHLYINPTEIQ
jgi:hypothetical protein